MRPRTAPSALLAAGWLAAASALSACDDVTNPTVDEPAPEPIEEAVDDRCEDAPERLIAAIEASLTVDAEVEHPKMVASEDDDLYFVAAELVTHEQEAEPALGIWAVTGDPEADEPGLLAVDAGARAYSELPDGARELGLSAADDGGEEVEECVEAASETDPEPEEGHEEPEDLRDEVDVEAEVDEPDAGQ